MAAAPIPIPANVANAILYLVFMPVLLLGLSQRKVRSAQGILHGNCGRDCAPEHRSEIGN